MGRTLISMRLPIEVVQRTSHLCRATGESRTALVIRLLEEEYVRSFGQPPDPVTDPLGSSKNPAKVWVATAPQ